VFSHENSFLGISVKFPHQPRFTVYNFYSPGRPNALAALLSSFTPSLPCILLGDFNAHHAWWCGSGAINDSQMRGTKTASNTIADWLEEHSFQLHNTPGELTHFPRNGMSPSTIDLSFSAGPISSQILAWGINHDTTSDHATCFLQLDLQVPGPVPRRAWSKANWTAFTQSLQDAGMDLSNLSDTEDTLRAASNISTIIDQALDIAVLLFTPHPRKALWWNPALNRTRKKLINLQRKAKAHPNCLTLRCKARRLRNHWKNLTRSAKDSYWAKRITEADETNIWKTIKPRNTHHRPIPAVGGQTEFQGKCDALRTSLFPIKSAKPAPLPEGFVRSNKDLRGSSQPVTQQEIQRTLLSVNLRTAPGHDRTPYLVLQKFNKALPRILPDLFTALLRFGVFPKSWKLAHCVVIPKPGKSDYCSPKSYRPISLLPCISKIFEKVVARRIAAAAAECGAIDPSQMGARSQYSAIDALLHIITPISQDLSSRKTSGQTPNRPSLLTCDVEGAFNNADPQRLLEIMRMRRLPTDLTRWVAAFTTERQLAFCFAGRVEDPRPFESGLPQGSPVSPILFLIYANAMMENQHKPIHERQLSYVDDIGQLQSSPNLKKATRRLKERVDYQMGRGQHLALQFAYGKSELLHCIPYSSKDKTIPLTSLPTVTVGNEEVLPQRQVKYLGVYIDESLSFSYHATRAAARGRQALGSALFLRHKHRGLPAYVANHLTHTLFLPQMLWASPAWWTGTHRVLHPLNVSYLAMARWITGLSPSTQKSNLLTCANLPPPLASTRLPFKKIRHSHPLPTKTAPAIL
jgi:hypothetical protein